MKLFKIKNYILQEAKNGIELLRDYKGKNIFDGFFPTIDFLISYVLSEQFIHDDKTKKKRYYYIYPEIFRNEIKRLKNVLFEEFENIPLIEEEISEKTIKEVWKKFKKKCYRCGIMLLIPEFPHHIIPRAEGGYNNKENLVSLCKNCHNLIEDSKCRQLYEIKVYGFNDKKDENIEAELVLNQFYDWHKWVYGGQRNPMLDGIKWWKVNSLYKRYSGKIPKEELATCKA